MIEAIPVKLPAFVITWDGTEGDANQIVGMLKPALGDYLWRAHYRHESDRGKFFELRLLIGSDPASFFLRAGDSLSIVVDPEDGAPVYTYDGIMRRDTIVLQEGAPRAIGH